MTRRLARAWPQLPSLSNAHGLFVDVPLQTSSWAYYAHAWLSINRITPRRFLPPVATVPTSDGQLQAWDSDGQLQTVSDISAANSTSETRIVLIFHVPPPEFGLSCLFSQLTGIRTLDLVAGAYAMAKLQNQYAHFSDKSACPA